MRAVSLTTGLLNLGDAGLVAEDTCPIYKHINSDTQAKMHLYCGYKVIHFTSVDVLVMYLLH